MSDEPTPGDLTLMVGAAVAAHEMFLSLMEGGFNEWQALRIVAFALMGHTPPASGS